MARRSNGGAGNDVLLGRGGATLTGGSETSGDDQFQSTTSLFHFDTANSTLYFSPDGTTGSATALAQVQSGVTLGPADIRIVG
ncbi:MAG TPA: hypothetical protein VHR44_06955 [Beijerinckiaceae bacterium]|nr:hypothetical protein [Beijerinckiaceae bacterium]